MFRSFVDRIPPEIEFPGGPVMPLLDMNVRSDLQALVPPSTVKLAAVM